MNLFKLRVKYQLSIKLIVILLFSEFSLVAMEKCPDCRKGTHQRLFVDKNDLFNAVTNKNIDAVKDILSCDEHKKDQMKFVDHSTYPECNSLLKAVIDNNYQAIEELVKAGDDLTFTNRTGLTIFNYQGHKNRQRTMTTIIGSLQTMQQINRFLWGLADFSRHKYEHKAREILCAFLKMAGSKYFKFQKPAWFSAIYGQNIVGPEVQIKLKEFRDIQKKKIHILLNHANGVNRNLPVDVTSLIANIVFPEN